MAIDIRAVVNCSLGPLISGSINDDYIQGSGLVKTRGSVELSGLYMPALGDPVEFSYTRNGITTYIPRKLRVLSSFADPYRRTTRVELGCKLTYLADKKDKLKWNLLDEPRYTNPLLFGQDPGTYGATAVRLTTGADFSRMPGAFFAKSIMEKCLTELGITASQNPLKSRFVREEFDYSAGYVQVLSDLLVSESYFGYLNRHEVLQVISLDQDGGSGRVIGREKIIDLGSIGAGQLPGEAVTVSYTTYEAKYDDGQVLDEPPAGGGGGNNEDDDNNNDDEGNPTWTTSTTTDSKEISVSYTVPGTDGAQAVAVFPVLTSDVTTTNYRIIVTPQGERVNVVDKRKSVRSQSSAEVIGGFLPAYLSAGIQETNSQVQTTTTEDYEYDADGLEVLKVTTTVGSSAHLFGALNLPVVFENSYVQMGTDDTYLMEQTVVETERIGTATQVTTRVYVPWYRTIAGQQAVAEARESFRTAGQVIDYVALLGNQLYLSDVNVQTSDSGYTGQRGPSQSDMAAAAAASPNASSKGSWRIESQAKLNLSLGSITAQRRIDLSLPYASDDVINMITVGGGGGGGGILPGPEWFQVHKGPIKTQARTFGRVQNKLLAGNRSGMSLQCAAGTLPNEPFSPFIVEANGLSALYRTNGSGWTFDSNGLIHSTDALFWGAVGGTGDFWFPVAPGITTLPTAPAVVDTTPTAMVGSVTTVGSTPQDTLNAAFPSATTGQGALDQATGDIYSKDASGNWVNVGPNPGPTMTVPAVVPIWNETVELTARVRTRVTVTSLPYALTLPTKTITAKVRTRMTAKRVVLINLPATTLRLSAPPPAVVVDVRLPATTMRLAAVAPAVEQVGQNINLPATTLRLSGIAPTVESPGSVILPATTLRLSGRAPTVEVIAPPFRYIRFNAFAATSLNGNTLDLTEIELYDTSGNKLTGITPSTNITGFGVGTIAVITDGTVSTGSRVYKSGWSGAQPTAYIDFDLGSAKRVGSVRIYSLYAQPRFPVSFSISGSNTAGTGFGTASTVTVGNGTTWTSPASNVYDSGSVSVSVLA